MKKAFVDCGFYVGGSLVHFKMTPEYAADYTYYGFDPMMKLEQAQKQWSFINLYDKAIWLNDGELTFFTSHRHRGKANSIYHNRRAGTGEKTRTVKCIDFSKWLKDTFAPEDFVIVKMDIEGAEYELIPKLLKDGTIALINIIYLEWHSSRVNDTDWVKAKALLEELKKVKGLEIRGSLERYLIALNKQKKG